MLYSHDDAFAPGRRAAAQIEQLPLVRGQVEPPQLLVVVKFVLNEMKEQPLLVRRKLVTRKMRPCLM